MKKLKQIEKKYSVDFGKNSKMKLNTYLRKIGIPSLAKVLERGEEEAMKKYWLFWEHRGYMEYRVFDSKRKAVKRFKEEDDGYQFPILIEGKLIPPPEEEK